MPQVAEARVLIAEARRRIEAERLLIAQARVAVAQARLLLHRGRHFDLVGDDYGNLSPAAPLHRQPWAAVDIPSAGSGLERDRRRRRGPITLAFGVSPSLHRSPGKQVR